MPLSKGSSQKSFVKNIKTELGAGKPMKQSLAIAYNMQRKNKRKKMADGGDVQSDPQKLQSVSDSFKGAVHSYADGGKICEHCGGGMMAGGGFIGSHQSPKKVNTRPDLMDHEMDHGYMSHEGDVKRPNMMAHSEDDKDLNQHSVDMHAETSMSEEDLVDRIMMNRKQNNPGEAKFADGGYAEGDEMYPHAKNKMFDVTNKYSEGGKVANQDEIEAGFDPNEFDVLHLEDDLNFHDTGANSGDELGNSREDEDRKDIVSRIMASRRKKDRLPNPR
jgi:hypothetical protein